MLQKNPTWNLCERIYVYTVKGFCALIGCANLGDEIKIVNRSKYLLNFQVFFRLSFSFTRNMKENQEKP